MRDSQNRDSIPSERTLESSSPSHSPTRIPTSELPVESSPPEQHTNSAQDTKNDPTNLEVTLVQSDSQVASDREGEDQTRVWDSDSATLLGKADRTTPTSAGPEPIPEIEGYTLLEVLGRGGMGIVYRAIQQNAGREVALKVILGGSADEVRRHRRFQLEAQAAGRINHPNVVTIYEVNFKGKTPFFSMQFVRGASLLEVASRAGFTPKHAAEYVAQAARGVHAAHELGILHRDLKPENILVDTVNERAYVTDFGLAKPQDIDHSLTQAGDVFGTPAYMSPEQIRDITHVDARSDVYSLGATLYRLLAGRNPFEAPSAVQLFDRIQQSAPQPMGTFREGVPKDLETICLKCLEKKPDLRYPSAGALARDLEAFVAGEPIAARPIGRARKLGRWIYAHPTAVTAATCISLLTLVAAIALPLIISGNREAKRQQELRTRISRLEDSIEELQLSELPASELLKNIEQLKTDDPPTYFVVKEKFAKARYKLVMDRLSLPRLTEEEHQAIFTLIGEFPDGSDRNELLAKLSERRTSWNEVLRYEAPFNDVPEFELNSQGKKVAQVKKTPTHLELIKEPESTGTRFRLSLPTSSKLREQLDVEFDTGWQQASTLGLFSDGVIDSEGDFDGWEARITLAPSAAQQKPKNIDEALKAGGNLQLQFLQGGRIVFTQPITAQEVADPTLRIRITRDSEVLRCQVNRSPEVLFDQGFSLKPRKLGNPGVYWPAGASVKSLVLKQPIANVAAQPLDEADIAFRAQNYEDALALYRKLLEINTDPVLHDECQFKIGLGLQQTKRPKEAAAEFGDLIRKSDSAWGTRAGCELLLMQLKDKEYEEARATLTQLGSRFSPEQISKRVAFDRRQVIFQQLEEHYNSSWVRNPNQTAKVQMSIDGLEILDGNASQKIFAKIKLLETQASLGETQVAFEGARKLVENDIMANTATDEIDVVDGLGCYVQLAIHLDDREHAMIMIEEAIKRFTPRNFVNTELVWLFKAKLQADAGDNREALDSLQKYWSYQQETADSNYFDSLHFAGWVYDEMGDVEKGMEKWKEGYQLGRKHKALTDISIAAMGSLSDSVTQAESEEMLLSVTNSHKGELAINFFRQFVPMDLIFDGTRFMWRTEFGKEAARRIATDNASFREKLTSQLAVAAFFLFKDMTLENPREFDLSHGELDPQIRKVAESLLDGYEVGRLDQSDFLPIGIAYLGHGTFLGWGSLSSSKKNTAEEKVTLGYCLGTHMARKGRKSEAKKVLQYVVDNTTDPLLKNAALGELNKLSQ